MRTIAAMKLDDGLLQAKTRLQTLNIAIRAVNESEVEHEQVKTNISVFNIMSLKFLLRP